MIKSFVYRGPPLERAPFERGFGYSADTGLDPNLEAELQYKKIDITRMIQNYRLFIPFLCRLLHKLSSAICAATLIFGCRGLMLSETTRDAILTIRLSKLIFLDNC